MKYQLLFALIAGTLCFSCYKDLGNYDYHDINEVEFADIKSSYTIALGVDNLKIDPTVTMTEPGASPDDLSRFSYTWVIQYGVVPTIIDTISTERVCDWTPDLTTGTYENVWFKVRDNKTNVVWKTKTSVTITTPYGRGIMMIGENEKGKAEVEMLSMLTGRDTIRIGNILANSGLPELTGPIDIIHAPGSATTTKVWVLTESGAYWLDRLTLKGSKNNDLSSIILSPSESVKKARMLDVAFRVKDLAGAPASSGVRACLFDNGDIYGNYVGIYGDVYGEPLSRVSSAPTKDIKAAPFLFYQLRSGSAIIWYDTAGERFMALNANLLEAYSIPLDGYDKAGDIFPWNQSFAGAQVPGGTLVYGENIYDNTGGGNGNSIALMKCKDDKYRLFKFLSGGATGSSKRACYTIDESKAINFRQATEYRFLTSRNAMLYKVGEKIYAYSFNPGLEGCWELNLGLTDPITMLKIDKQAYPDRDDIYIATYNASTKGTLRKFVLNTANTTAVEYKPDRTWTGLMKVKNMSWRGKD